MVRLHQNFDLTENYWNRTVILTGTHMNYSHTAHEFSPDHSSNQTSTTSLNLTLNF